MGVALGKIIPYLKWQIKLVMRRILEYCLYLRHPKIIVSIVNANQGGMVTVTLTISSSYIMPNQHMKKHVHPSIHQLSLPSLITSLINIIEPVGE
jgi:hypothetical protein